MDDYFDILTNIEQKVLSLEETSTLISEKITTLQSQSSEMMRNIKSLLNEEKISPRAKITSRIDATVGNEQLILQRLKFLESRIDTLSLAINKITDDTSPSLGKTNSSPALDRSRPRSASSFRTQSGSELFEA
jgi:chromosome segregation ATPase